MKETSHTPVTSNRRAEKRLETLNLKVLLLLLHISTRSRVAFRFLAAINQAKVLL
jgi:hypothetical protein